MKGTLKQRSKGTWTIILDLERDVSGKRRQKWHTVSGTKRNAEEELTRILQQLDEGKYVNPSKITVKEHLDNWLTVIEPQVARKTFVRYEEICKRHLIPALGTIVLRKLTPEHIDTCYADARTTGR